MLDLLTGKNIASQVSYLVANKIEIWLNANASYHSCSSVVVECPRKILSVFMGGYVDPARRESKVKIKVEGVEKVRKVTSEGITSEAVCRLEYMIMTIRWIARTGGWDQTMGAHETFISGRYGKRQY